MLRASAARSIKSSNRPPITRDQTIIASDAAKVTAKAMFASSRRWDDVRRAMVETVARAGSDINGTDDTPEMNTWGTVRSRPVADLRSVRFAEVYLAV